MDLILDDNSSATLGMRFIHETMLDFFGDTVCLIKHWGPVQMCVYYLEYEYIQKGYKIIIECERGIFTINVKDQDDKHFSPWMIYPESRYYHWEDKEADVLQLVCLTHKAIENGEIRFLTNNEAHKLPQTLNFAR